MVKRIQAPEGAEPIMPDPGAVKELRRLVEALPGDLTDWEYVNERGNIVPCPAVLAFLERVGLSAFLGAEAIWPNRAAFLRWATEPCRSLAGPGGPGSSYARLLPCFRTKLEESRA